MSSDRSRQKADHLPYHEKYLESYQRLVSFWIDEFIDSQRRATIERIRAIERNRSEPDHKKNDFHAE